MVLLLASGIGQTVWQQQLYALALCVCLYKSPPPPQNVTFLP
jgi:hypothetical protein